MSSYPLQLNNYIYTYDFTDGQDKVYGNMLGHNEISSGVWGMISADGNANGYVNNEDKVEIWAQQSGSSGYLGGGF
ncbi:MAG: hypothetical protein K8R53_00065 [Bacteroidales bacterium]|nr:hypothetical protein [Bacteroidales bacterium]